MSLASACGARATGADEGASAGDVDAESGLGDDADDGGEGEDGGDGSCPPDGCLDAPNEEPDFGDGWLYVARGVGDGTFQPFERDSTESFAMQPISLADGSTALVTWGFDQLCLRRIETSSFPPPTCVEADRFEGGILAVEAMAADDDSEDELLVATDRDTHTPAPVWQLEVIDDGFATPVQIGTWAASEHPGTARADFDGDGYDEVFLAGFDGDCATGCSTESVYVDLQADPRVDLMSMYGYPVAGRLDDDGISDLWIGSQLFVGKANERPVDQLHFETGVQVTPFAEFGDLDGHGSDELYFADVVDEALQVAPLPLDPAGPTVLTAGGASGNFLKIGDIDGDQMDEVLSFEIDVTVDLFVTQTSSAGLASEFIATVCENCRVAAAQGAGANVDLNSRNATALADFDGDGHLDFAVMVRTPTD